MNAQGESAQSRETADGNKEYLDEETNEWVSKSELKKRQTERKKLQKAAEKAAAKKATVPAAEKKVKVEAEVEEINPSKYA